ncbi:DegT/DnrJ/EryC1/StrS family aminotransferase [Candidatus Gottesmanbacteria bacterium]|nr:DegT/DnrJ/EryC1/StrS family aminotransferase [Candidatus Gottesmanbacteria bacterium]
MKHIPLINLSRQYSSIQSEIDAAISRVLNHADFILGEDVEKFEKEFARFTGAKYCVSCANGTDAIKLILMAIGVEPRDEVIVQANTFIATLLPIIELGATPVLVDCDEKTGQIDVQKVKAAITPKTRAILPVHLYGHAAPVKRIIQIPIHNTQYTILEDCAQSIGSLEGETLQLAHTGNLGVAGAFSFYPGKNLGAYGDGGAVITSDKKIRDKIRILRNIGQDKKYHHLYRGLNSRLDTLQAAILRVKLKHINNWNKKRHAIARTYISHLQNVGDLSLPDLPAHEYETNWHLFIIRTNKRDSLADCLNKKGIATAVHYPIPLHLQPALKHLGYKEDAFPASEKRAKTMLSLPIDPLMTEEEVDHIVKTVITFFS